MTTIETKMKGKTQVSLLKNGSRYHIAHQLIISGKATALHFDYSSNSLANAKKKFENY